MIIGHFGIIADLDTKLTISLESLDTHLTVSQGQSLTLTVDSRVSDAQENLQLTKLRQQPGKKLDFVHVYNYEDKLPQIKINPDYSNLRARYLRPTYSLVLESFNIADGETIIHETKTIEIEVEPPIFFEKEVED